MPTGGRGLLPPPHPGPAQTAPPNTEARPARRNAALFAGRLASPGGSSQDVSRAARAAPRPSHPPRAPDLLLDGFAVHFTEGYAVAAPILRRALSAFDRETSAEVELRWLWLGCVSGNQ